MEKRYGVGLKVMDSEYILEKNKNLVRYNTMGLHVYGDLVTVKSEDALGKIVSEIACQGGTYKMLGKGSNIILPDQARSTYIRLDFPFNKEYLSDVRDEYIVPANLPLHLLSSHAVRFGLKGWEVFTGIPATVGGAICTNAGTRLGDFCEIVKSVRVMDSCGDMRDIEIDEHSYSYRKNHVLEKDDIVVAARLVHSGQDKGVSGEIRSYLEYRSKSQPLNARTSGCIFKNTSSCGAGELLDKAGLKGFQFKGMKISEKHANFMVNEKGATAADVGAFIDLVKSKIMLQYGIELDVEVEI